VYHLANAFSPQEVFPSNSISYSSYPIKESFGLFLFYGSSCLVDVFDWLELIGKSFFVNPL